MVALRTLNLVTLLVAAAARSPKVADARLFRVATANASAAPASAPATAPLGDGDTSAEEPLVPQAQAAGSPTLSPAFTTSDKRARSPAEPDESTLESDTSGSAPSEEFPKEPNDAYRRQHSMSGAAESPPSPNDPADALPKAHGLSAAERLQIMTAASSLGYSTDMIATTIATVYGMREMEAMRQKSLAVAGFLGASGFFAGLVVTWLPSTDVAQEFMEQQFQAIHERLDKLWEALQAVPYKIESSDALQTYIEQREAIPALKTALKDWQQALFDPAMLQLFQQQCDVHSPLAFLKAQHASLTADGSCEFPTQCWLAADAGAARMVGYSRPGFLEWVKLFVQDAILAADFAVTCAGGQGAHQQTLINIQKEAQGLYTDIVNNLAKYYDSVMTTAFWEYQFEEDLSLALNAAGSNQDKAVAMQAYLENKYDFLEWIVYVWDAVVGSDKQGFVSSGNADPPGPSCSLDGGSIARLRVDLKNSQDGQRSFMVMFTPSRDPAPSGERQQDVDSATSDCAGSGHEDMLELVKCQTDALKTRWGAWPRGSLCMRSGDNNLGVAVHPAVLESKGTLFEEGFAWKYADGDAVCYTLPPR